MKIASAFWRSSPEPATSRSTQLRRLFTRCCLITAGLLCLGAFQHEAQAQIVTSQCTNPVCKPGRPCAQVTCGRPCFQCFRPTHPAGTSCVVGYALGNEADFAGGDVPDVLIESTDYWEIDDYGDVWYDGSSTTGPVQETTLTLPPSCIQTSGSFVLQDPLAEYEGSITMGTFTYQGLQTQFYAWPQVFYDDGDRSFIDVVDPDGNIDFYQYSVRGVQRTTTIPANSPLGNASRITKTIQVWRSADLRLPLLTVITDPLGGTTTSQYENVSTSTPPDSSLFTVPAGYKTVAAPQSRIISSQTN
jgi:hypothetical protein